MRPALRALGLCLALLSPMAAKAQDLATLIADKVAVSGDNSLVASGGVEVLYQGRRLRASRIIYDKTTDKLQIEGPITLSDGSDTLVLASAADLSADLTNGVLTSARLVLNQQLQVAAARIFRVDGRYTSLPILWPPAVRSAPATPRRFGKSARNAWCMISWNTSFTSIRRPCGFRAFRSVISRACGCQTRP